MPSPLQSPQDPIAKEIQCIVSQILHDFISHFTAISTGLDMPLHMAKEIFPMLLKSRKQMNAYLNLTRYLFSSEEGSEKYGTEIVTIYGNTLGINIFGHSQSYPKIITGLTLWATKYVQGNSATTITRQENMIHIHSPNLKTSSPEMDVLLDKKPCKNPRESFSAYLARLLHQENCSLNIDFPKTEEMIIKLHKNYEISKIEKTF